jgi:hypothetical protein
MKNLFLYLLALLVLGATFSCDKEDVQPNDQPTSEDAVRFAVDLNGLAYVVEDALQAYAYTIDNQLTINGIADIQLNETVALVLPANLQVGTYELVPQGDSYAIAILDGISYSTQLPGSNGEVTITAFDGTQIEGTFHFDAKGGDYLEHSLAATEGCVSS